MTVIFARLEPSGRLPAQDACKGPASGNSDVDHLQSFFGGYFCHHMRLLQRFHPGFTQRLSEAESCCMKHMTIHVPPWVFANIERK